MPSYDVVVVGAGPAGLSAALVLGRCRRTVLVCDSGEYRNACSREIHAYLGRDATPPDRLRADGRREVVRYPSVRLEEVAVRTATAAASGFEVELADGRTVTCRKLLLATGVVDELPPLPRLEEFYGRSAFHCPYCDGWEQRDRPIAVYGRGHDGLGLALELTVWSRDLVLFTDGPSGLDDAARDRLRRNGIAVEDRRIAAVCGEDGQLTGLELADGEIVARTAMFFITGQRERSGLAAKLGCRFNAEGTVETGDNESTDVPGLFVAGDASRRAQLAVVAAAEGAQAAAAINTALLREDLR
ncbi:Thioredoxin reductase [Modestobacter sp. DSM 44400]|uniref:NAD(P)/FAD-dependent oxidoreductase n=1 Tax=Modestobacter sp. DSM 44400 TaxID=1550230 RepID=UPI00089CDBD7|nr:NAD(P)/FAD-dependent oxidoreductase [Modestobacter sp. DSM 44400]SDY65860.1 Thioredoxin reductase [Modestobacter sp. DSM 44400]